MGCVHQMPSRAGRDDLGQAHQAARLYSKAEADPEAIPVQAGQDSAEETSAKLPPSGECTVGKNTAHADFTRSDG